MARRRCSLLAGMPGWKKQSSLPCGLFDEQGGPGRRETHTREMGRSLTTWDFHTRDPRHGDGHPVGERVILTGSFAFQPEDPDLGHRRGASSRAGRLPQI